MLIQLLWADFNACFDFTGEEEKVKASTVPVRPAPPPPSQVRERGTVHSEVVEDDEAKEVENKVYMFDTESEDEEPDVILVKKEEPVKEEEPVRQRKAVVTQEQAPPVNEIQSSIMDMSELS